MTDIDFYILQEDTLAARDHFACRLAEKAINMGRQVVISVNDNDHAESMSQYLWSFKPESFVPHIVTGTEASTTLATEKVLIDWQGNTQAYHDVLINLKHEIPKEFSRFQKLSEIVVQEKSLLPITRSHFQFYRDRGYPLKSHKIS
ncbi:MAG: DNA polymerase-3 subunit chi [Kiritimatiellia bacterium]|jgi:DNA polymerase-3 subunit chi